VAFCDPDNTPAVSSNRSLLPSGYIRHVSTQVMVTTGFSEEGQQLVGISLSGAMGAVVESVSVQGAFMASPVSTAVDSSTFFAYLI
jgi:hypothetical protein